MSTIIFANNVSTTLSVAVASTDTSIQLASSANLPTLAAGEIMPITINDATTRQNFEIMYATAIAGTTLTVTRAQEGTAAQNWAIGDYAYCAVTKGTVATINGNPSKPFVGSNLGYVVADKAALAALDPSVTSSAFVLSSDGGPFKAVTGAAPGTYSDNGGSFCGTVTIPAGGDGSSAFVRMKDALRAEFFGAKRDGATDDSSAINLALAVSGAGGGPVELFDGSYATSSTISVPDNAALIGAGKTMTTIVPTGSFNAIEVHGASFGSYAVGRRVQHLTVDGTGLTGIGVSVKYAGLRCYFSDMYIHSCTGIGLKTLSGFDHSYERIECRSNSSYGVQSYENQVVSDGVYEEMSKLIFNDVWAIANNSGGIQWDFAGGDNCVMNNCKPSEGTVGVDFSRPCNDHHIANMMTDGNGTTTVAVRLNDANVNNLQVDHLHTYNCLTGVQVVHGQYVHVGQVVPQNTIVGYTDVVAESTAEGPVYLESPNTSFTDNRTAKQTYPRNYDSTYSPSWNGASPAAVIGNGTLVGESVLDGNRVDFRILLTVGSTSTVPGTGMGFSLPHPTKTGQTYACSVLSYDLSATTYYPSTGIVDGSGVILPYNSAYFGSATPFAWGTGDTLLITGSYFID